MRVRDGRLIIATLTSRRLAGARRQLLLCRRLAGGVRGGDHRARLLHDLVRRPRCLCLREGGLGDAKGGGSGGHAVVVVAAAPTLEEAERTRGGRACVRGGVGVGGGGIGKREGEMTMTMTRERESRREENERRGVRASPDCERG